MLGSPAASSGESSRVEIVIRYAEPDDTEADDTEAILRIMSAS